MKHRPDATSRLARIWRQWTATRLILQQLFRGYRLDNADCALFSGAAILLFLLQVENLLWARLELPAIGPSTEAGAADPIGRDLLWPDPLEGLWIFPFGGLTAAQTSGFWLAAVVVYLINAWLLDRWLSRLTGHDSTIRGGLLKLRGLLLGVPWLGLAAFPAWQAVLNIAPRWALKHQSVPLLDLDLKALRRFGLPAAWRRGLEWLAASSWVLVLWLVPVNMLAIRMGLAWLNVPERTGSAALLLVGLLVAGLHYAGFACLVVYFDVRAREHRLPIWKSVVLGSLCFTWLLPMPLPLLSFFVFIQLEGRRIKTIVHDTYESRAYPSPFGDAAGPGGDCLPWPLSLIVGSLETTEDSVTRYKLLKFYRAKTLLLVLDAGSLMLAAIWLDQHLPSMWLQLAIGIPVILLLVWGVISGFVGLLACTAAFFARFVRSVQWRLEQDHHPVTRYLLLVSLAFLSGVNLANTREDPQALAASMLHVGALAFIFSLFYLLPAVGRYLFADGDRDFGLFLWPIVFQAMAQFGYVCQNDPEAAAALSRVWRVLQALTPLWALLLFAWRGSWLARPYRWRDAFNPAQPRPIRRRLALMLVTAALPLGGLAIPFWIRARRDLESRASAGEAAGPEDEVAGWAAGTAG